MSGRPAPTSSARASVTFWRYCVQLEYRPVRRANESDGAADAVVRHLAECVGQKRMPVAHAEIDGEVQAVRREPRPEPTHLTLRDGGERRHAAERLVVVCHRFDPLGRNAPTT